MLKRVRIGAAAAGVAAALVITGCSSDSGNGGDGGKPTETPQASASTGADTGGSGSGSGGTSGSLQGSWVTTSQGKSVALLISGKKVALVGEHVCSGTAGDEMGMQMFTLKCADGNTDRNMGQVKSVDATTLKVSWEGFGDDTFRKTDNGKLPSGFPTMGLPKS
ncbi:hypothetical protein ACFC18_40060 [Streptomyces sp. NPDC056121]|uniref:hypothetical protein n=1 Tax=Streptomyces TaxID=1883 RepID=UPI001D0B05EF|nr:MULTISPECIES: hypothetical protein [Streptomyces]MCX5083160.1 hypothetical protein [Streptomyces sp. NBC_00401]UDM01283.1 hypothetical protein LGI35_24935 [Streptomyces longhuiensis]